MFRGSYNTGFRVPSFNQIFNGTTISPNPGNTLVDPTLCPTGNDGGTAAGLRADHAGFAERRQSQPRAGKVEAI